MRKPVCQYDFRDRDLRSHGCTLASLTYLAREMADGDAWVDPESFASRLQKASGVSLATFRDRGTKFSEGRTAYESVRFEGRVPPRLALQRGIDVRAGLLPMLQAGRLAMVAVNYGVVQDAGKGVGSFRGGHAVVVGQPDGVHVDVADPLRRDLVRWRVDLLVRAMETFGAKPWGNGRGEAAVPLPVPTWLEQARAQRDKARAERDAALKEADAADRIRMAIEAQLETAEARIAELEAEVADPDAPPPVDTVPMEFSYADYAVVDGFATLPDGTRIASTSDVVRVPVLSTAA